MGYGGRQAEQQWATPERRRAGVVVVKFLAGRTAVEQLNRMFRLLWFVVLAGLVLLVTGPRWLGAGLVALAIVLSVVRFVAVRVIERAALGRRYRDVEDELAGAVEAGRANVRRELERVGLPSSRWRMPMFMLRLARRSGRERARGSLERINLDQVLPRAQIDRAMRILSDVWRRTA